jgi:hypothetical protein
VLPLVCKQWCARNPVSRPLHAPSSHSCACMHRPWRCCLTRCMPCSLPQRPH